MHPVLRALLAILLLALALSLNSPPTQQMATKLIKRSLPPSITRFLPKQAFQAPFLANNPSIAPQPIYTRTFNTSYPTMAPPTSAASLFDAVKYRHSVYTLTDETTISNDRIQEIVQDTLLNVPSAFNSQSTRLVLVLGEEHKKLWELVREVYRQQLPPEKFEQANQRFGGFQGAYGTVLFYEDTSVVREFQEKFKTYQDRFPGWSEQTNGMHQYVIWTAFELEGLGANLQHYNPLIDTRLATEFDVPETWELKAQLVFGKPTGEHPGAKPKNELSKSLKVFGK
ncbi:MAG: hypothetical protein Q9195_004230 [Heterodermia aff. obscurata]